MADAGLFAVLDDDPTGPQNVADTHVVLDWSDEVLARLPQRSFHVITNTRALRADEAEAVTRDAARAVLRRFPDATVVLRGDSTLRAHLREEYLAVRDGALHGISAPLLLVPALPEAGRITVDGEHLLRRNGTRTPLADTEYARDGRFTYRSSRLLDWAEERSGGLFPAASGIDVPLEALRARGGRAVHEALAAAARRPSPTVCAPDAETDEDLMAIADGYRAARREGIPVVVRCAPAFAALLCGTAGPVRPLPRADSLLIVCGSYVPQTTRQLATLAARRPGVLIEAALSELAGDRREGILQAARSRLVDDRLAVVATPRTRDAIADDPDASARVSEGLAFVARALAPHAGLIAFKGGITAATGIRDGLGARVAVVEGPVGAGVALWRIGNGRRCLVFPGNVGDDDTLADVAEAVLA